MTNKDVPPAGSAKPSSPAPAPQAAKGPSLIGLLRPYRGQILLLIALTVIGNAFNLVLPLFVSRGIDAYVAGTFDFLRTIIEFAAISVGVFVFIYAQNIVQTYASERVARDLRTQLSDKISRQTYGYVQEATPSMLLTNLTSDIEGVKMFVSVAIPTIASSLFIILGASVLLTVLDWRLAMVVLTIIPIIALTFFLIFRRIRGLFVKGQQVIDWLNRVINESILGSSLIRVLNSQQLEYEKFLKANAEARDVGLSIVRLFASLIPIINIVANSAVVVILLLGGWFVVEGSMTLGNFAAFNSYVSMLIFPIIVTGFMSNVIARSAASYGRIAQVLGSDVKEVGGTLDIAISGDIEFKDVSVTYGGKPALKHVSFTAKAGKRTAIIGPTGGGKSQLLFLLTGLIRPQEGEVRIDDRPIAEYLPASLHRQIGFVFQDSVMFNLSIRENIAFSETVTEQDMLRALETAELTDFIAGLPQGLETVVSERGTSLSGGQKQRIMLARALALNPKILLLDDFTARVDTQTEQKILQNVAKNYPGITLLSVTQKIASVRDYDSIVVLMEGEMLAQGTHEELLHRSPEYVQIEQSQRSTSHYE